MKVIPHFQIPELHLVYFSGLLDLRLLPVSVLEQKAMEQLYSFHYFSFIIMQAFHSLYHKDCNILLAASAVTNRVIAAELAVFRAMSNKPGSKVFYSGLRLCSKLPSYNFILIISMHRYHHFIWRNNNAQLYYSHHFISTVLFRPISALKGPSVGSTTATIPWKVEQNIYRM